MPRRSPGAVLMTKYLFALLACTVTVHADTVKLNVFPARVELHGPRAEQRIGVLTDRELTRTAIYSSANPKIATVDRNGVVRPISDGETSISIEAAGQKASVPVVVKGATADIPVSYSREINPIFVKTGCNSGA